MRISDWSSDVCSSDLLTGTSFTMFDFTPVGLALTAAGIVFLLLFFWILPRRGPQDTSLHEALDIKNYVAEAKVVKDSAVVDKTVADLLNISAGEVVITSILRSNALRIAPLPDAVLRVGDILLLEGEHEALDRLVAQAMLSLTDERKVAKDGEAGVETTAIEAIVGDSSSQIGRAHV